MVLLQERSRDDNVSSSGSLPMSAASGVLPVFIRGNPIFLLENILKISLA